MVVAHKQKSSSTSLLAAVAVGAGAFLLLQMIAYGVQTKQEEPRMLPDKLPSQPRQMSGESKGGPFADEFFSSPFLVDSGLVDLKKEMDRQREEFLRSFSPLRGGSKTKELSPAFKFEEDEKQVTVVVEVPDVRMRDINIEVIDGTVLHVSGGRKTEKDGVTSEVRFDRRFALGRGIDQEKISAKLKNGKLTINTPKVSKGEGKQVRKIPIAEDL